MLSCLLVFGRATTYYMPLGSFGSSLFIHELDNSNQSIDLSVKDRITQGGSLMSENEVHHCFLTGGVIASQSFSTDRAMPASYYQTIVGSSLYLSRESTDAWTHNKYALQGMWYSRVMVQKYDRFCYDPSGSTFRYREQIIFMVDLNTLRLSQSKTVFGDACLDDMPSLDWCVTNCINNSSSIDRYCRTNFGDSPSTGSIDTSSTCSSLVIDRVRDIVQPDIQGLPYIWSKSQESAALAIKLVSVNTSQYIKDLVTLKDTVQSVIQLGKGKVTRKTLPKQLSNAYLTSKYGVESFLSDTIALSRSSRKRAYQKKFWYESRGGFVGSIGTKLGSVPVVGHAKIMYVQPAELLGKVSMFLQSTHIIPDMVDLWDWVPFSFIVNWFGDIDEKMKWVDNSRWMERIPVLGTVYSTKYSVDISNYMRTLISNIGLRPGAFKYTLSATGSVTFYDRWVDTCLTPPLAADRQADSNHFLELLAILIQRT